MKPDRVDKATITRETLYNCWTANKDGAGIMFAYQNKLVVWKGLMTFEKFMRAWAMVPSHAVAIAHFRIGTHGGKNEANTHPFWVEQGEIAVVHNGILSIKAREADGLSDTATFVEDVLKKLPVGWMDNAATLHLIDGYIGGYNKLVFLNKRGRVLILNEQAGVWDGDCWYSNGSYRQVLYVDRGSSVVEFPRLGFKDRWAKKAHKEAKPKRDGHKDAAVSLVAASRARNQNDDAEVCKDLCITMDELRELVQGSEDEAAIRSFEIQVEKDRLEQGRD